MNKPSAVRNVVETSSYKRAYKKLLKDHRKDVIEDLTEIIEKLMTFQITKQARNHPLKGAEDAKELHVRDEVLLVYRYVNDSLVIDLILLDLVTHKELKRKY